MKDLKIVTSFVSPINLDFFINRMNFLPIFIIRSIGGLSSIEKYSNTVIHFKDLAPSSELFREKRDGRITIEEFKKRYILELSRDGNLYERLKDIEKLATVSNASGIVLMSLGSNWRSCHRSALTEVINGMGILNEPIKEYGV